MNIKKLQVPLFKKENAIEQARITWIIDSGCTMHMTNTREVLVERESIQDSTQVNGAFSTQEAVLKGPAIRL